MNRPNVNIYRGFMLVLSEILMHANNRKIVLILRIFIQTIPLQQTVLWKF